MGFGVRVIWSFIFSSTTNTVNDLIHSIRWPKKFIEVFCPEFNGNRMNFVYLLHEVSWFSWIQAFLIAAWALRRCNESDVETVWNSGFEQTRSQTAWLVISALPLKTVTLLPSYRTLPQYSVNLQTRKLAGLFYKWVIMIK